MKQKPTTEWTWAISPPIPDKPPFERVKTPLWWLYGRWHPTPKRAHVVGMDFPPDGEHVTVRLPIWFRKSLVVQVRRPL